MILKITTASVLNLLLNANESKSQGMPRSKPQSPRPPVVAHAKRMRHIWSFTLREYQYPQRHLAVCTEMMQTFVQSIPLLITTPFVHDEQRTRHTVNSFESAGFQVLPKVTLLMNRGWGLRSTGKEPLACQTRFWSLNLPTKNLVWFEIKFAIAEKV